MGAQANYVQGVKEKLQAGMGSEGVWWYLIQEKKKSIYKEQEMAGRTRKCKVQGK